VYEEGSAIMKATHVLAARRLRDESGQALAEYSLIITFIAAVCVLATTLLGVAIAAGFGSIIPGF